MFRALDPQESGVAFSRWAAGPDGRVEGAGVGDRRIVLGQQVCRHGRNEITDIPELPDLLSIKGTM